MEATINATIEECMAINKREAVLKGYNKYLDCKKFLLQMETDKEERKRKKEDIQTTIVSRVNCKREVHDIIGNTMLNCVGA